MSMKKNGKKLCKRCGERKAIFVKNGVAKWDKGHDLCPACWRSLMDRMRNKGIDEIEV